MHLNDGMLRAYLDHELDKPNRAITENHLAACADCRARVDEMSVRSEFVAARFSSLAATPAISPQAALNRFKNRRLRKEIPLMQKIFNPRYRPAWAMVAVVALLAVSMTFEPVRVWAEGVLAQFRVSNITVVSVDSNRLDQLGNSQYGKQISQLLSDSVTVTKKPGASKIAVDVVEAGKLAGFTPRLPTSRSDKPQFTIQDSAAFQFVVNRGRAQQLLNEMGASNLKLPASVDGAVIKVNIPAAVAAGYGDCPALSEIEKEANTTGSAQRTMSKCIILTQAPSPVVDAPPDLDVVQLAELGLQFTGMSKEQAHAYAQTVNWTSTLVVPIPRNAAQHKKIAVDGVEGYLIERTAPQSSEYVIVWVKNGIIYAIGGIGSDTTAALAIANSLK